MEDIIKKITEKISPEEMTGDDKLYFSDPAYETKVFSKDNFHHTSPISSEAKIAFIDGGNRQIISSPDLSVDFVRIYFNIYKNFEKMHSETTEIFSVSRIVTRSKLHEEGTAKPSYQTSIYPYKKSFNIPDEKDLVFNVDDESIKEGIFNGSISKMSNIVRRFSELYAATEIVEKHLGAGDMIVLDGTLQESVTHERPILQKLLRKALEKEVLVTGLAKTSSLITRNGSSVERVLERLSKDMGDVWYYHPSVDITKDTHPAEMYFIKLHKNSKFIFRFEVYKEQDIADIGKVVGCLALISQDPVFLGYPYGLIDADSFARVSEEEANYLKTRFRSISKDLQQRDLENTSHEILDSIKFLMFKMPPC